MVLLASFVYVIFGCLKNIQLIFYVILVQCTDLIAYQSFSNAPLENKTKQRNIKKKKKEK